MVLVDVELRLDVGTAAAAAAAATVAAQRLQGRRRR